MTEWSCEQTKMAKISGCLARVQGKKLIKL